MNPWILVAVLFVICLIARWISNHELSSLGLEISDPTPRNKQILKIVTAVYLIAAAIIAWIIGSPNMGDRVGVFVIAILIYYLLRLGILWIQYAVNIRTVRR